MLIHTDDILAFQQAAAIRFGDGTRITFHSGHAAIETDDSYYGDHWTDTNAELNFSVFAATAHSDIGELLEQLNQAGVRSHLSADDRAIHNESARLRVTVLRATTQWNEAGQPSSGTERDVLRDARSAQDDHARDNHEALARIDAHSAAVRQADEQTANIRRQIEQTVDRLIAEHRIQQPE